MLNKYICMHKHIWGCMHTVTYGQILVGFPCLKMSAPIHLIPCGWIAIPLANARLMFTDTMYRCTWKQEEVQTTSWGRGRRATRPG